MLYSQWLWLLELCVLHYKLNIDSHCVLSSCYGTEVPDILCWFHMSYYLFIWIMGPDHLRNIQEAKNTHITLVKHLYRKEEGISSDFFLMSGRFFFFLGRGSDARSFPCGQLSIFVFSLQSKFFNSTFQTNNKLKMLQRLCQDKKYTKRQPTNSIYICQTNNE